MDQHGGILQVRIYLAKEKSEWSQLLYYHFILFIQEELLLGRR